MDITPVIGADRQVINGYGDGGFRISSVRFEGSVLVFPERVQAWPLATISELTEASLAAVLEHRPGIELLLLGCGRNMAAVPRELRANLRAAGIVIDAMDTAAACRTYNVLLAEERRVAAALIAV
jgi:uncharacterized protein